MYIIYINVGFDFLQSKYFYNLELFTGNQRFTHFTRVLTIKASFILWEMTTFDVAILQLPKLFSILVFILKGTGDNMP